MEDQNGLQTADHSDKVFRVAIPQIQFPSENCIKVGSKTAIVAPDSRQAHVLKYFYNDPTHYLPKDKLIDVIHQEVFVENTICVQDELALWQSSTQVLCRLRRTLSERFRNLMPKGTEWLPFSEDIQGWLLYKLPAYGSDGAWH